MDFYNWPLTKLFDISQIISVNYFEYSTDFSFASESHSFWKLLYVDKGTLEVTRDCNTYSLKKGALTFCKPNQHHAVSSHDILPVNFISISFGCPSEAMALFKDCTLLLEERERSILATIISESSHAFSAMQDDSLSLRYPGAEQMLQLSLEQFLISLHRKLYSAKDIDFLAKPSKTKEDEETLARVLSYMNDHISQTLTIHQLCHDNLMSYSQLQRIFRTKHNCGIIDYFSHMKITRAKELIQESNLNFTQIADALGYTSIHYFSRQFKKITGMSPSQYASSMEAAYKKA